MKVTIQFIIIWFLVLIMVGQWVVFQDLDNLETKLDHIQTQCKSK